MRNAMMRNSTQELEHRELLDGVKQRKEIVELASEHLPQIFRNRVFVRILSSYEMKRVGADGVHRYLERI